MTSVRIRVGLSMHDQCAHPCWNINARSACACTCTDMSIGIHILGEMAFTCPMLLQPFAALLPTCMHHAHLGMYGKQDAQANL